MSVYNGDKYLKESIISILNQTLANFKFVIINDASTDNSLDIIKNFSDPRIKLINNSQNIGLTKSLNIGLKECQGKYIARIDTDDLALPNRLQVQYDFMEANPNIALCGSNSELINENGEIIGQKKKVTNPLHIKFKIIFTNPFLHPSLFFRKDIIKQYNEEFLYAQDYELTSRLIQNHSLTNIPETLIKYRVSNNSITENKNSRQIQLSNALKISTTNANYYLNLSLFQVKDIIDIINNKKINLFPFLKALKNYKKITSVFISKENLNKEQSSQILSIYKSDRNQAFKNFFKSLI